MNREGELLMLLSLLKAMGSGSQPAPQQQPGARAMQPVMPPAIGQTAQGLPFPMVHRPAAPEQRFRTLGEAVQ